MNLPAHKKIQLSNQPRLSLGRTMLIAVEGVRYRLFRATVTVAVIAVAVAFLMNILSESLIKRALASESRLSLMELRSIHRWVARLTRPAYPESIIAAAASADLPESFYAALGAEDARDRFISHAKTAAEYLAFFDNLDYDNRRTLIHTLRGADIFNTLRQPENFTSFKTRLDETPAVRFITPMEDFSSFLESWPQLAEDLDKVSMIQQKAVETLNAVRGRRSVFEALADPEKSFMKAAQNTGFQIDNDTATTIVRQAQAVLDRNTAERTLTFLESRQLLAQQFNILPSDVTVNHLWRFLENQDQSSAYLAAIGSLDRNIANFENTRLTELALGRREEIDLERVERLTAGTGTGWLGLGDRMGWLLMVSMLVCAIGITNAMLMTVTERFREIATMKCLGALDEFIMLLFVLESCLLGLAGGIAGSLLGNLIGFGRMASVFGTKVFSTVPAGELAVSTWSAIVVGVILAAVAAVYPSLKAARLSPMEAMRVE